MAARNNETLRLDLSKSAGAMQTVYLGQGDRSGTVIRAEVYDEGALPEGIEGCTCNFEMMLPDMRHHYEAAGTLAVADGVCTVEAVVDETYAASVPGTTDVAYFSILSGDEVVASTGRFRVVVLKGAAAGDPSEAWTNGIAEAIEGWTADVEGVEARADAAVARANAAAAAAEGVILDSIPTMSATVKGGAKAGTGLEMAGTNLDVLQVSQALRDSVSRNLSPFFSAPLSDVYNVETNPGGYWVAAPTRATALGDGWAHVQVRGGAYNYNTVALGKVPVVAGTLLIEVANFAPPETWTDSNYISLNGSGTRSLVSKRNFNIKDSGVYTMDFVPAADQEEATASIALRLGTQASAGAIELDLRLSYFEGDYTGGYKPYLPGYEEVAAMIARTSS